MAVVFFGGTGENRGVAACGLFDFVLLPFGGGGPVLEIVLLFFFFP